VEQLPKMLVPVEDGGILSKAGVVDYSVGKGVAPGVFAIVKAPHPRVDERMRDLKVGDGPYYALIRPFHLTSLETPLTAARMMLHGEADMQPLLTPVADVASMAKRDMEPGVVMGRIGQEHYRGFAVTRAYSLEHRLLPLGIAERAVVTKAVKAGELLTYDNCRPDETMHIVRLRRLQDEILAAEAALLPKKAKEKV
jgi:predicted homoserine dehydrogenase-like protein